MCRRRISLDCNKVIAGSVSAFPFAVRCKRSPFNGDGSAPVPLPKRCHVVTFWMFKVVSNPSNFRLAICSQFSAPMPSRDAGGPGRLNCQQTHQYDVLIIGGGVAGLSAARELLDNGCDNICLVEAQDRLGGRVKQVHGIAPWPLDAGAEIIHGEDSDLAKLLQEQSFMPVFEREYPNYVYWPDTGCIEYVGHSASETHPVLKRMYDLLDEVRALLMSRVSPQCSCTTAVGCCNRQCAQTVLCRQHEEPLHRATRTHSPCTGQHARDVQLDTRATWSSAAAGGDAARERKGGPVHPAVATGALQWPGTHARLCRRILRQRHRLGGGQNGSG